MMRTTSKLLNSLAAVSAVFAFCTSASAAVVYDNSLNDLNRIYSPLGNANGVEFGDEINLAAGERLISGFQFEYFLGANASGNETAQLILRANDGAPITRTVNGSTFDVASPNTVLYTSPVLTLGTGYQIADAIGFAPFEAPNTFTWSVTFQGIEANEVVGLRLYDPPTIGTSFADFWQRNDGTWNTYIIDDAPANFAARVTAVPEPTTFALALMAGLGWLGFRSYRRRSS
jgi:hypothetical protein